MKYEKSAASSGINSIAWGFGILFFMAAVQIFWCGPNHLPTSFVTKFWLIGLIPVAICVGVGVTLICKGGGWQITIDREGINWVSPWKSVDDSFQIALEDLDRVETRISKVGSGSNTVKYVLVARSGAEQKLNPSSGIKLKNVIAELERLGVTHEVVNVNKRRKAEAKESRRRKKELARDERMASHA